LWLLLRFFYLIENDKLNRKKHWCRRTDNGTFPPLAVN